MKRCQQQEIAMNFAGNSYVTELNFRTFWFDPMIASVDKMVTHSLKILQQMLQEFYSVTDHFVDTRRCTSVKTALPSKIFL